MLLGHCKLCHKGRQLIQSHLLPRAIYDLCRTADSEPVVVSSAVIMQSSRQTKVHLLCAECDNLLSKYGENWVLPKLATWDKGFPLYDLITRIRPDVSYDDVQGYAASRNPAIDVQAITHFALGVFWKAAVHSWSKGEGEPRIELGPYEEQLRRFLRCEGDFPNHVVLNVGVVPPPIKFVNSFGPYRGSAPACRNFVFNVPGMQFVMTVGKALSAELRETCFYRNAMHPIIACDIAKPMLQLYRQQAKTAHKSRKLVEYLATRKESLKKTP